ncbi:MAG TPA: ABC transporter ATP-binding protein [Thermoplasmata archaeon]|nr:ABC transporter ATP-binding protein [Thermoplasmata archaeon]
MSASIPSAPTFHADHVTVRYRDRVALHDVSLEARSGEFIALTGPNGSGKTTLLRAGLGLLRPSEGQVRLLGRPSLEMGARERARRVAWVPQEEFPRDNLRVVDYVLFGRYAHWEPFEVEGPQDLRRARAALDDAGLLDRADSGILELSGGERQRALLARALVQEAPVLLLDEPTAYLDIGHELDLLARVRRLVADRGGTVIAAMHDLNLAARFADRMTVLSRGRVVDDGPPREVLSESLLREVWGVTAELRRDPATGQPYLLPMLTEPSRRRSAGSQRAGTVHVVGGGGAAGPVLRRLAESGFRLTAGALNLLDSDAQVAEELEVVFAAEVPFAPVGEAARAEHRRLLTLAEAIVVAPFAVGPSNLVNLEDLRPFAGRTPMFLLGGPPGPDRDYTGGAARSEWAALVRAGARIVSLDDLTVALAAARPAPTP